MESLHWAVACLLLLFIASSVSPSTTFNCPSLVNAPVNGSVQLVCSASSNLKNVIVSHCLNDTNTKAIIDTYVGKCSTEDKRITLHMSNASQQRQSMAVLHINNVKVSDAGNYNWFIEAYGDYEKRSTELRVEVPYSNINMTLNQSEILCETHGGSSEGQIHWLDGHENNWTKSSEMVSKKTEDGHFILSSVLHLKPLSIMDEYCCIVVYELMGKTEILKSCIPTSGGPDSQVGNEDSRKTHLAILIPVAFMASIALVVYFYSGKRHFRQGTIDIFPFKRAYYLRGRY